ncbi:hypothetical protein Mal4_40390 [Maioricimonas rarisocia]|uniref:Uncharacterized protein n=1 Tax=Maioricimonas rarisocia TaxID=2528026 RepID=A0A517ZB17_9PLAN|nr:hypothetical protein [Maioricimonas rarisocia]QDU39693.1 hypothetical protein Mal4_40390 [Maioricimonas rarisocia]
MPLQERTGLRDLTFSAWHRPPTLPGDCSWIDIDCCQFCDYCNSPLALFELVWAGNAECLKEVCQRKVATITQLLAVRLSIPAYKIAYTGTDTIDAAALQKLGAPAIQVLTPGELAEFIDRLHDCEFCKKHRSGRFAMSTGKTR